MCRTNKHCSNIVHELCGALPDVAQENVSHHLGSCYNGALGFVESAGVVFDVAHLPH